MEALAAITHLPASIDAPSWMSGDTQHGQIVACTNGLLRISDRKLLDHTPDFFNLVSVPFDYDPAAPPPTKWLEFLGQSWPFDADDETSRTDAAACIAALQEFYGYVLSGRTHLHKIMLIVGPTRSGKGTIARTLSALVGKGNVAGPTLSSLTTNFGLQTLIGKPLAVISDARMSGRDGDKVVERLLNISGEDALDVDRKYRDPWTGRLPSRFLILSNQLPNFGDASGVIARRFVVLSMKISWLNNENHGLQDELTAELTGILNWALDGLDRLTANRRFTEPPSSSDAVIMMVDNASPTSAFVRDWCKVGPAHEVSVDMLYTAWRAWCEHNGREKPGTKQLFGRNLQSVAPQVRVARPRIDGGGQVRVYVGIALKNDDHNALNRDSSRLSDSNTAVSRDETRHNPLQSPSENALCQACGEPMTAFEPGQTTHPMCEPS